MLDSTCRETYTNQLAAKWEGLEGGIWGGDLTQPKVGAQIRDYIEGFSLSRMWVSSRNSQPKVWVYGRPASVTGYLSLHWVKVINSYVNRESIVWLRRAREYILKVPHYFIDHWPGL